ncbi:MAG: hypothetical protein WC860_02440 [Candidatus Margulisiibacteriota bacterium]|jgi:hypothetical protein
MILATKMTLFKNKFKVASSRLKEWNYSQDGYYFLTICTKNRENWFGEIPIVERFIASKELSGRAVIF